MNYSRMYFLYSGIKVHLPQQTKSEVDEMDKKQIEKQIDIILKHIELLRAELELLIEEQGISEETIRKSQELDEYITKYYKHLEELKKQ
ncbi:Spo0E family sporulation regulatory protein-aspartic acid phosphatase [Tepidimicrobium xylanilyticum]|nr:Spo0E family sporulation regulatory protein-aspartic acid phosphatase [Tepidimicrobium xylanilyticum]